MERSNNAASPPLDVIPLHSTNLLTVLDEDGVIKYESPSIERIFGFDQDDLIGEQVADYFHPEDRETVLTAFDHIVVSDGEVVESVEYRHQRADDSFVWVESVGSANPTPNGNYVINTRDISEQRSREQALQSSNEQLERFARFVSHDLQNPLNVAQGRLALARQDKDDEELAAVANALDRMEALIDDMLALARSREAVRDTEAIDIASLSHDCWETVATEAATLDVDTDVTVKADRVRLRQLLENLMRNACEHSHDPVTVKIGGLSAETGFYVEDTGPGIDDGIRDSVFDEGFSTKDAGTGFGLPIVKKIVDAHNWEIAVGEGDDGGVRFEVHT